jgi:hypothetical protein
MNCKGSLSFVLLLFLMNLAWTQVPQVSINKLLAERGSSVFSEVKVSNFNKIVGLQFSLSWDPKVISYKGVSAFGMDLNPVVNFGTQEILDGTLIFSWYDATLNGITLPNESVVFKIEFVVTGESLSSTVLKFGDDPAPREIVDTSYKVIQGTFTHGEISVLGASSRFSYANNDHELKIYPNPMEVYSGIEFDVETDKNVIIEIIDQQGRIVNRQKNRLNAGKQNILIYREEIPGSGLYRVLVSGENFFSTQNLMVR